ncbi:hypothetical protein [Caulobacter sp. Root343]|uniref:hypothetical protein n=1 Tax=Caulobacter sp. Root343 TaxID=1736520 RepID=UPI0006F3175E|nr:hypothetical protein [Caulobacter sp. Root343]KQV66666.1 hypothetical protein ASC70_12600 [Caulobacter sp. Root343]
MTAAPRTFTDSERHTIANALSAAARRWNEFADELARVDVAERFRKQAEEADAFATLFLVGNIAPIAAEPASPEDQFRTLLAQGLLPSTVRPIMAEQDQESHAAYIAYARERLASVKLEIDDVPEVSEGSDGCWVAAWVWISDEQAGVTTAQDDEEGGDDD